MTQSFLNSIMLSIGIHPNLLKRSTELAEVFAFKIIRVQRGWILRSLNKLYFLVFPHTEQQYSNIGLIKALYKSFQRDKLRYFSFGSFKTVRPILDDYI